jgi:hypothetical protein
MAQNDHGTRRVRLQLFSIELIAEANVKDAGNHGVYPIFGVLVWHQLNGARHLHPDDVRAFVRWVTHNNCEAHRRRERREWLPVDILRSDRLENGLPWLMQSHSSLIRWFRADCGLTACHSRHECETDAEPSADLNLQGHTLFQPLIKPPLDCPAERQEVRY